MAWWSLTPPQGHFLILSIFISSLQQLPHQPPYWNTDKISHYTRSCAESQNCIPWVVNIYLMNAMISLVGQVKMWRAAQLQRHVWKVQTLSFCTLLVLSLLRSRRWPYNCGSEWGLGGERGFIGDNFIMTAKGPKAAWPFFMREGDEGRDWGGERGTTIAPVGEVV